MNSPQRPPPALTVILVREPATQHRTVVVHAVTGAILNGAALVNMPQHDGAPRVLRQQMIRNDDLTRRLLRPQTHLHDRVNHTAMRRENVDRAGRGGNLAHCFRLAHVHVVRHHVQHEAVRHLERRVRVNDTVNAPLRVVEHARRRNLARTIHSLMITGQQVDGNVRVGEPAKLILRHTNCAHVRARRMEHVASDNNRVHALRDHVSDDGVQERVSVLDANVHVFGCFTPTRLVSQVNV